MTMRAASAVDTVPGPVRVTATLVAGLAAAAMPAFLTGALQGRIAQDLGIGTAGIGVAVAAYFVVAGLSSIPAGWLVDRIGTSVAVRIGMGLATTSSLAIALFVDRPWQLMAALAFAGPAMALVDTGGSRAMSRGVPRRRQGLAFGSKEASMPIASLLAGLTLPLIGAEFGWRPAYVGSAVLAVVTGLLVSGRLDAERAPQRPPHAGGTGGAGTARRETHGLDDAGLDGAGFDDAGFDGAGLDGAGHERGTHDASRDASGPLVAARVSDGPGSTTPLLVLLALAAATTGAVASSLSTFLVPTAEASGMSSSAAGLVLALASLAAAISRVASGMTVDRLVGSELSAVALLSGSGSIGVAALALAGGPLSSAAWSGTLLVAAAVLALGAGWASTGLLFLSGVRVEPRRPALSGGVVLAGLALGGSLGRALYGFGAEQWGFPLAWGVAAPLMASAAIVALVLRGRIRRFEAATRSLG